MADILAELITFFTDTLLMVCYHQQRPLPYLYEISARKKRSNQSPLWVDKERDKVDRIFIKLNQFFDNLRPMVISLDSSNKIFMGSVTIRLIHTQTIAR